MIFIIWTLILISVLIIYMNKVTSRFSKYGVRFIKPVPLLGNVCSIILRINHLVDDFDELKVTFPGDRFVGRFEFMKPVLIVFDPELVKKVTVKDFEHFVDHRLFVDVTIDPFFGRNLFSLKGQEWKDMRSHLTPAFTGSKMKLMVPFMEEVAENMITAIKKQIIQSETSYIDVDGKDIATRYATDVIASCAFGLKVDSHSERENKFYKMAKDAAYFGIRRVLVLLGYTSAPVLSKLMNLKFFTDETSDFYKGLVRDMMRDRESRGIIRHDMIHLLMEAKKGILKHDEKAINEIDAGFASTEDSYIKKKSATRDWTHDDIVAQVMIFLAAGFETVSVSISFMLHELAVNPEVQERLYQEIKLNKEENNGNFDSIQQMKYLDMVISEVLRLWPPAVGMDRLCIKDYNMGKSNKKTSQDYIIRKGEALIVPIWEIHRNPQNYSDPHKFDPERFNDENKLKIKPFTYIPFGTGPRNCIGSRFALCELKVLVCQLLQHFVLSPCEKTQIPVKLANNTFNLHIRGGSWIRMKLRKETK